MNIINILVFEFNSATTNFFCVYDFYLIDIGNAFILFIFFIQASSL